MTIYLLIGLPMAVIVLSVTTVAGLDCTIYNMPSFYGGYILNDESPDGIYYCEQTTFGVNANCWSFQPDEPETCPIRFMIENCEIDDPVSCGTCSKERGVGVFQLWHDCEFPARHFVKAPKPCCCDKMPATGTGVVPTISCASVWIKDDYPECCPGY